MTETPGFKGAAYQRSRSLRGAHVAGLMFDSEVPQCLANMDGGAIEILLMVYTHCVYIVSR